MTQPPYFRPGGTLDPRAESYLVRAADESLLESLLAREYVFVLDSRQKGKSSLVARAIVTLHEHGVRTVKLDLQRIGANVTPEQWYAGLLAGVGDELGLRRELFAYWGESQLVGPLARWVGAWRDVVLPAIAEPIVVFVDEVDFVRSLSFSTDEFFAGIRDCFNRRAELESFGNLTFCLIGVATPAQLIKNPEITPFNIGRRLELEDFTLEETKPFEVVLDSLGHDGATILKRIHHWVNGHPYLTQLLCSRMAEAPASDAAAVDRLVHQTFLTPEARHREPNLADVERRLLEPDMPSMSVDEQRSQVLNVYAKVLRGGVVSGSDENPLIATLRLSGACTESGGRLVIRNTLYTLAFNEAWRKANLPDAERRRQRVAAWKAVALTSTISGVILVAIGGLAIRNDQLAKDRERLLQQSKALTLESKRQTYTARMSLMAFQAGTGNGLRLTQLLDLTSTHEGKGWEWHRWNLILHSQRATHRIDGTGIVAGLTRGGQLVTIAESAGVYRFVYSGGPSWEVPPQLTSWAVRQGLEPEAARIYCAKLSRIYRSAGLAPLLPVGAAPDGSAVAYYDEAKRAFQLRRASGETVTLVPGAERPNNTPGCFSPDGRSLVLRTSDALLRCFDTTTGRQLWASPCGDGFEAAFSPDGNLLAVAPNDERVFLFDAKLGKPLARLTGHTAPVRSVQFSQSGKTLLTGSQDGTARIWSVPDRKLLQTFRGHREMVMSAAFSPNELQIVTLGRDGEVRIWDVDTPPPTTILARLLGEVHHLSIGAGEASWHADTNRGALIAFDPHRERVLANLPDGSLQAEAPLAKSPDGRAVASTFADGSVRVLDAATLRETQRWNVGATVHSSIQYSPNGERIAVGLGDGRLLLLSPGDPRAVSLEGHSRRVRSVEFSPLGDRLASASQDGSVRIWSVRTGLSERRWTTGGVKPAQVAGVSFSHDGRKLVCALYDSTVAVLRMDRPEVVILRGHSHRVFNARFSPDDTRILSFSFDGTARLWDAQSGREIATMRHDSWVSSAWFSQKGDRIVTTSADKTVRVWDGYTGDEYIALKEHTEAVFDARFTDDDTRIVSVSNDGTVRIWKSK